MRYKVSEVFPSLQGEGFFAGEPVFFVRLFGCAVGCPWCDTKYAWAYPPIAASLEDIAAPASFEVPRMAYASAKDLAELVVHHGHRRVVVTGGEPLEQDMGPLLREFRDNGLVSHVETSGTAPVGPVSPDWLTVSPKIDMPGGKTVLPDVLAQANEIKMPVGRQRDVDALLSLLQYAPSAMVFLQPLSLSRRALDLCIKRALEHGWRVSLQSHRYTGIR